MVSLEKKQKETTEIKDIKDGKKVLVLLDAHALLHRAFHALPPFTSPDGEPTGALYGFVSFLIKLIRDMKPEYIAACYDLAGPTFRHEAYKDYKGTRQKTDESLIPQFNRSRDILKAFNIPSYSSEGFEADDMLGTIVEQTKENKDIKVIIASGDLDTLQLVQNDRVMVYTLKKGINDTIIYNEIMVKERYGFEPKLLVDFKSLRGDPSDNIIGVPGIGEKGASDIIKKFGTIANLYKILKEDKNKLAEAGLKPRLIKLLEDNEENALFSRELAEIRRDAPINFKLEECDWRKGFDINKAKELFVKLGFKSLTDRLSAIQ